MRPGPAAAVLATLRGDKALRNHHSPSRRLLIHSLDNYARGTPAGPALGAPAPVPVHRCRQARPCAARAPQTLPPVPRCGALWPPGAHPRPPQHTSAHAPRPARRRSPGLRPASPPQTCRLSGAKEARVWRPPAARDPGAPLSARWLHSRASRVGPPTTHLSRVRTKGPALSRLKPLGPPHTPQCPRSLLVLDRPPIGLLLVHLKGLWARAARSLKGAASRCVSRWTRRCLHGWGRWSLPGASCRRLQKEGRKACVDLGIPGRQHVCFI